MWTHIDLFSGIGGFALAAQWAGFKTVVFCENNKWLCNGLRKAWPTVPIENDARKFDGTKWAGCTLLTAGVPCQPASRAGKQCGANDNRWLWPEALRIIAEARPTWALLENPLGIEDVGLDRILSDLESLDYEVGPPLEIPACALNAPHRRTRLWILAHSVSIGRTWRRTTSEQEKKHAISYPSRSRRSPWRNYSYILFERGEKGRIKPGVCGMAYGVSRKLLEALGNAIVPQVAYEIMKAIRKSKAER